MERRDVIVIGGGPCGLSAAIELQNKGLDVLVIEKANIVNSIYNYPTHQTFFSSSLKLSIGQIPFITAKDKPKRIDALVYYREVVKMKGIQVNNYEHVQTVHKGTDGFRIMTSKATYKATQVVVATGYYDNPNTLDVAGGDLPHVHHYFKEAHPYFQKKVVVIGGKNSAIDAALELERAGAFVTVIYRGSDYSSSIKPWILPGFESLVNSGAITMHFDAEVIEVTPTSVIVSKNSEVLSVEIDAVYAMIGYHPDHSFLKQMGIQIDEASGRPLFDEETMETNVKGLYVAGVIAAGNNVNEIFIENGRVHGVLIASAIQK